MSCLRLIAPLLLSLLVTLGLAGCTEPDTPLAQTDPLRPHPNAPSYWAYDDAPVLLLGGSREDNLFQISDLESHLDTLAASGGNYIRNTMSSRDSGNVWPFHELENAGTIFNG